MCAKFSWNLLRFGCRHYSNTLFYECVSLLCHIHRSLGSSFLWFALTSQRQGPRVREKQYVGERHVKKIQYKGIETDKQNITHIDTENWSVFVAETV